MSPHPQQDGRAPLAPEQILERALAIVDAEGLDALTMRRLASDFNVEAMALYYHFPNKQAILDGVVNTAVLRETGGRPLPASDDWRVMMRAGILTVRRALLAHPNVAPLVTTGAAGSPAAAVWVEGPLSILHAAGLRRRALVSAYHQLVAYAIGWHLLAGQPGVWQGAAAETPDAANLAPVSRELGDALGDWSDGFEEGLDALLNSIDARVPR